MLVTQADYLRWQALYGGRQDSKSPQAANSQSEQTQRQPFAAELAHAQQTLPKSAEISDDKTFLEDAFEKTLHNRLGIDQEAMEALEQQIEDTKSAIEALNNQKPLQHAQKQELTQLESKLEKLEQALERLIEQANERETERARDEALKHRNQALFK